MNEELKELLKVQNELDARGLNVSEMAQILSFFCFDSVDEKTLC